MFSLNYKTLLVGSAAAALFAGCGSGDLSSNVISTECDYLFRCAGGSSQTAFDRLEYGTESGCVAAEQDGFDVADEYRQFIDAGTVVIDNGAADRCLRALRATCTNTLARQLACDRIFVGQVADGGGCVDDVQCASGQCDAEGFEQCGSCMALIPTGSPCEPFVQSNCAPGPNGEDGFCSGGRCALRELEPELTEDAAIGTDCDFDQLCEAGLYCQDGTCARWRELGEACDLSEDSCGRGAFCRQSQADPGEGTCVPVRIESGPGEDCGLLQTEVVVCDQAAGLYCNDFGDGVCALYEAEQTAGEFCDATAECVDGLTCRDGICVGDRLVDGSACVGDVQCQSGNCVQQFEPPFEATCEPAIVCL
jgi:hypothetical protein